MTLACDQSSQLSLILQNFQRVHAQVSKDDFSESIQWATIYLSKLCGFDPEKFLKKATEELGALKFPSIVLRVEELPRGALIEMQVQCHKAKVKEVTCKDGQICTINLRELVLEDDSKLLKSSYLHWVNEIPLD